MSLLAALDSLTLNLSKLAVFCHVIVLRWRGRSISIGSKTKYFGKPILMIRKKTRLHLGEGCTLRSNLTSNVLGVQHPIIFCTLREGAELIIGDGVGISGGTFCAASSISIGKSTLIGANTTVADTDFHPIGAADRLDNALDKIASVGISIGENVFIGTGCLILKGVSIGDNSVIGAGSVVTKSIPCDVVAAGNPCVVLKRLLS